MCVLLETGRSASVWWSFTDYPGDIWTRPDHTWVMTCDRGTVAGDYWLKVSIPVGCVWTCELVWGPAQSAVWTVQMFGRVTVCEDSSAEVCRGWYCQKKTNKKTKQYLNLKGFGTKSEVYHSSIHSCCNEWGQEQRGNWELVSSVALTSCIKCI